MITVYSQPHCPHCDRVIRQLEGMGEPYQVIDVAAHPPQRAKLVEQWGYKQVPVVEYKDDTILNPNPVELEEFIYGGTPPSPFEDF